MRLPASALAFLAALPLAAQSRAFTGATLIDGTGRAPVPNATLVVRDGRVLAAGATMSVTIPPDAERVDLAGKVVIPGLINAHGHVTTARQLDTYARYGVTTVFSLGDEGPDVFAAREGRGVPVPSYAGATPPAPGSTTGREGGAPATGPSARVFVAGPVLAASTPDEARAKVAQLTGQRVDFVKIRVDDNLGTATKMAPEVYRAVIDEAHRRGARVAAHLFYLADARDLLTAGADLVAHSIRDADVDAAVIAQLRARNTCVVPTLMREVSTFVYEDTPAWFRDSLFLAHPDRAQVAGLVDPTRQEALRKSPTAQRYKAALEVAKRNVKALHDAGVRVAMGTDTGPAGRFQGYFELMELELMVQAGLTPAQALRAATSVAADCMGVSRELGTLEAGKWADFVVLDASPLTDIANVRKISSVWIAGNRVPR